MPRAPQLQQQVQAQALPGVRLQAAPSPESFGANTGQLAARIGAAVYDQELQIADRSSVMEAETLASKNQLRIQQDVYNMRGKNAANAPDYALKEYDDIDQQIMKGLANDRQRGMYQSISRQKREMLNRASLVHANQEAERFGTEMFNANMKTSIDVARSYGDFPLGVEFEKNNQSRFIGERAAQYGYLGTPQYKEQVKEAHSATNRAVIEGLITKGDDLKAKAFYDKMLEIERPQTRVDKQTGQVTEITSQLQFTAQDREAVQKIVEEGSTRGEAHRQTIKILGEIGMETPEQRRQALNMADAMDNEKVGELVRKKLEHRFAQEDKRKQEEYQGTFTNATKLIDEQWKQVPTASAREMVPAPVWADLGIQDRHTLETYVAQLRDPGKKATDLPTWVKLNAMKDDDLAKLSRSQMLDYLTKLDNSDGDKLLTRWNGVLNAKEGKQTGEKYEQLFSNKQLLDNAMELTGYFDMTKPRSKWPVEHQQLENRVQKLVDQALSQIPKDAPREKKEKAIQDIVDAQVKAKVKVDKGIFSFEKDRAVGEFEDFKDAASIRVPLKEIPVNDQDTIKGILRQADKKLDPGKIERIYALKQLQKAGKIKREDLIDQTRKIVQE